MTLSTPSDLQYSLLEFIAHLTAENYEDVPYDLVKLDFLREDKVELLVKTGALEPLYYFLRQANQGGGGTKVRERIFDGVYFHFDFSFAYIGYCFALLCFAY